MGQDREKTNLIRCKSQDAGYKIKNNGHHASCIVYHVSNKIGKVKK
jgi:hypothetical protein